MEEQLKLGSFYKARNKTIWYIYSFTNNDEHKQEFPLGCFGGSRVGSNGKDSTQFHPFGAYDPIEHGEHPWDLVEEVYLY